MTWDPAKAHCTRKVKALCDKLNIVVIFIPASLTYKYQLVDVCFAATFKEYYSTLWTRWFVGQLEKAYMGEGKAYMPKSLNYIKPSIAVCILWVQVAFAKMKRNKSMFKRKAVDLYMAGEDAEMALLITDQYAGKFKSSYNSAPWSKK